MPMRPSRATVAVCALCAGAAGPALAVAAGAARGADTATTATAPVTTTLPLQPTGTTQTATITTTTTTTVATPQPNVCLLRARRVIAARLRVRPADVRIHQRIGSNGMPQCNYLVSRARGGGPHARAVVVVNVDNGPQPLWRLMRKVVEASQIFGVPPRGWRPPKGLYGLGPYASWFPNLDQLMADNDRHTELLTVSIIWRRARPEQMISLARAAIRPYRLVARYST